MLGWPHPAQRAAEEPASAQAAPASSPPDGGPAALAAALAALSQAAPAAIVCLAAPLWCLYAARRSRRLRAELACARAAASTAEAERRRSEERFRMLTELLPQLVWSCTSDGACIYLSRQWVDHTGIPEAEQLGFAWLDRVIHADDRERVRAHWLGAVAGEHPYATEFRIRRHDGTYCWFMTRGTPLRDVAEQITSWFGTCTDIGEQKQVECALQEALALRDEFVSVASHELRTPLTSLTLQAQALARATARAQPLEQARVHRFVAHTNVQLGRLARLVDDMLDVTRIRSGQLSLAPVPVDLCPLVDGCVERLLPLFEQAGYAPPTRELQGPAPGLWDPQRIEQVVTNLLTNALRYGQRRPVTVRVRVEDTTAVLEVQDLGIGLTEADQAKIFGRFERAISRSEVSGLGLGLFIAQQILAHHDGSLAVTSAPGRGSTFTVRLPLAR